jgi:hypothetical protein
MTLELNEVLLEGASRTVSMIAESRQLVCLTGGRAEERTRLLQRLEKLSGHTVLLTCEVDATLLGGAVVEMDGRVMDGSVRGRLREIKEVIGG